MKEVIAGLEEADLTNGYGGSDDDNKMVVGEKILWRGK